MLGSLTLTLTLTITLTLTRLTLLRVGLASGRATLRREHGLVRVRVDWPRLAEAWGSQRHDLALKEPSGEPAGRGLSHPAFDNRRDLPLALRLPGERPRAGDY